VLSKAPQRIGIVTIFTKREAQEKGCRLDLPTASAADLAFCIKRYHMLFNLNCFSTTSLAQNEHDPYARQHVEQKHQELVEEAP
jgi:hypothetical protein